MSHIVIDAERCKGCELCASACPKGTISPGAGLNSKGYRPASFDEARATECTGCTLCGRMCPDVAITVYR